MFSEKEKGMTIVEMMAVFFIIAVVLSISLIGYKQNQQNMVLNSAALKLAADIRKQQSIVGLDDTSPSCIHGEDYKYGYGIRIIKFPTIMSYLLFSDCDGNNYYSTPDIFKTISFPSGVELEGITTIPATAIWLSLVFYPPGPSVLINGNASINEAKIVIRLKSDPLNSRKTITINKVGMIDVK